MQYKITKTVLTDDTKKFIYKDFAEHSIKAIGFNGLSNDPVAFSFQAPEFYQKLGFKVELKRDGYSEEASFFYLRKDLC